MIHEIESTWTDDPTLIDVFSAMARVERICMRFKGLENVPDLPPPKLSDPFPTVTRWAEQTSLRNYGFPQMQGRPNQTRFHESVVKIFVACASLAHAERGDLQLQYKWVTKAFDDTYAANHTLDGAVNLATLQSPAQWATAQRYGGDWFCGWMLSAYVKLRYRIGAS